MAFLDWEAAEPHGMPLWDLLYFMRSYAAWASQGAGTADPVRAFSEHYLQESPLGRLLGQTLGRYCERIGLAGELVEPLVVTCWMHRALKEATRLPPDEISRGHYAHLVGLCIDERRALRRVCALDRA